MNLLPPPLSRDLKEYIYYSTEDMDKIFSRFGCKVCGVWCVGDKEITVYRSEDSLFSSTRNIKTDETKDVKISIQEGMTIEDTIEYLTECEATINANGIPEFSIRRTETSKLAKSIIFDKNNWAISLIYVDGNVCQTKLGHAEIIIEGINDQGEVFTKIAHLRENFHRLNASIRSKPEIIDAPEDLKFAQKKGPWLRAKGKVLQMINRIELECKEKIPIPFNAQTKDHDNRVAKIENCFTWAVNRLRLAEIHLKESVYHTFEDMGKILGQSGYSVCGMWWIENDEVTVYRSGRLLFYKIRNVKTEKVREGQIPVQEGMTTDKTIKLLLECEATIDANGNPEFFRKTTKTSCLTDSIIFDKNNWAVSLIYVSTSFSPSHAEIVIEGINDQGKPFVKIAHLQGKWNLFSSITGEPEIREIDSENLRYTCKIGPWLTPKGKVLRMINRIEYECENQISVPFNLLARGHSDKGVQAENCFIWAINRLSLADIRLGNIKSIIPSRGFAKLKKMRIEQKDAFTYTPSNGSIALETPKRVDQDPSKVDINGRNALHLAVLDRNNEQVEYLIKTHPELLEKKDNFDKTPLLLAASRGFYTISKTLIKAGADCYGKSISGKNALHLAARNGREKLVKLFSHCDDFLESRDKNGFTPLLVGAKFGHREVCLLLLNLGANSGAVTRKGRTIQDLAHDSVKDLFLAPPEVKNTEIPAPCINKASFFSKTKLEVDPNGRNQLHQASIDGNIDNVKSLLSNHLELLESRDKFENTPLLFSNDRETSEILLQAGANKFVVNGFRRNVLHMAVLNRKLDMVELFCTDKELLEGKNICGSTPLMEAAEIGEREICKLLLKAGASSSEKDTAGYSLVQLAKDSVKDLFLSPSPTSHVCATEEVVELKKLNPELPLDNATAVNQHEDVQLDLSMINSSISTPQMLKQSLALSPKFSANQVQETHELAFMFPDNPQVTTEIEKNKSKPSEDSLESPSSTDSSLSDRIHNSGLAPLSHRIVEEPLTTTTSVFNADKLNKDDQKQLNIAARESACSFLIKLMNYLFKIPVGLFQKQSYSKND